MTDNPFREMGERVAEVQVLLDDHAAGGKNSAVGVMAKAQAVLSEPEVLRAMFDVGYFPPNMPLFDRLGTANSRRRSVHVKVDLAADTTPKTSYNDALRRDSPGDFLQIIAPCVASSDYRRAILQRKVGAPNSYSQDRQCI